MVQAVLFLSFGVSCLLAWLGQPFFVYHQCLWFGLSFFATGICGLFSFFATGICVQSVSFTAFSAVGIRVRLFVFAFLALVSGYQCISQFLVSCCTLAARQLHPWRFELEFFPCRLPCGQLYKFRFEANPIWYSSHKVYEIALSEVLATQMGVTEAQHQSQLELTHFCLTAGRFHGNSCIVMLWVACELLHFAATQ